MELPQFKTCCCGCSLRTGTLIQLWLYVIGWIIVLLAIMIRLLIVSISLNVVRDVRFLLFPGLIFLIVGIITAIGIAGLLGVYKDRHSYLIPYLSLIGSLIVLQTIVPLVFAGSLPFIKQNKEGAAIIFEKWVVIVTSAFLGFAFNGYFWLVVYSYYRVVKERSSKERSSSRNLPYLAYDVE